MSLDVYAIGHALVDIQARISDEILARTGYHKGVMTLVDEAAQTKVLSALSGVAIHRCAGGSAANTVMGIADFGGKAAFAGKVGNDALGEFCIADMRQMGVTMEVPKAEGQTGTSVVLITADAQRTMLTHLGVSSSIGLEDVDADLIAQAKYVYIEGYLFTGDRTKAAALRTIELAKKQGVQVAFTVSDPFLINLFRDEFWELIKGPVDLLFCNLEEARSLTGMTDPIDCAQEIHRHAANVALTLGEDGSLLMHEGKTIPIESVPTSAIDTTGAGDMYAAGLLWGITNGLSWQKAGHVASHAAARIVAQLGARLQNRFTPQELAELAK
ncbi:MAG: PfkB domain protein [Planctomycetaceae bacterium]|nr:PfkB domain protein [Planctomycetaceae bacterium]